MALAGGALAQSSGAAAGPGVPASPVQAAGMETGKKPASPDDLRVAVIGAGEQGRVLIESMLRIPGIRIVALCDIWDYSRQYGSGYLRKYGHEVNVYEDYRDLLAREKGLDAAVVATQAVLGTLGSSRLISSPSALGAGKQRARFRFDFMGSSKWFFSASGVILAIGANPIHAYSVLLEAAFGSANGFAETMIKACPLLLAGLGVTVAFRARFWNIGAEGQIYAGGIMAAVAGIYITGLPAVVHLPLTVLAGAAYTTVAHGSLTIGGLAGAWTVTVALDEIATGLLTAYADGMLWAECKALVAGSTVAVWDGVCDVARGIVQTLV